MRKIAVFCGILSLVLLSGCKSKLEDPHLVDPIYSDIQQQIEAQEEKVVQKEGDAARYATNLKKATPQTGEIGMFKSELHKAEKNLKLAQQELLYLRLQLRTRKKEARMNYNKAFARGEEWPSPETIKEYELYKKLKNGGKTAKK